MPNYIVLRLLPPTAVDSATFTSFLNNLTIKVYDISYGQPSTGTLIGSAAFVAPPFPPPPATHIVQHSTPPFLLLPLQSVATALILYPPPTHEYVGPDLRIEFDRGGSQLFAPRFYYDVQVTNLPGLPPPNQFQLIPASEVSAFVTLPPLTSSLTVPGDGTPPKFEDLLAAVTAVLNADPALPVTPALLAGLSVEQCRNIANEIVYGPQAPLPSAPEPLESMYTDPPNFGGFGDSHEQNRQQFQGQLAGYYGPRDATVLQLTNFIYALSAAEYCELQTIAANQAIVTFPVNPTAPPPPTTTVSETQVIFSGATGIDVPAAYFYALSYDLSTNLTKDHRYNMILGSDQQANLGRMTKAVDAAWINLPVAMNPAQATRILDSLNVPSTTTVPQWNVANPSAHQIFQLDWVNFPPVATWRNYQPGDDIAGFWQSEAIAHSIQFLDLVLFALTQGYTFAGDVLADEIKAHLLSAPLNNVNQIATSTPTDWQHFFNTLPGLLGVAPDLVLPTFTLPGSVPARIAAFIYWVRKFFQMGTANPVLNPVATPDPLRFGVPAYDLIAQTMAAYPGFALGIAINLATLQAAAAAAIPGDPAAQAWAVQAIEALNELFILSQVPAPNPAETPALDFSIMEALFARGFTSREAVLDLPLDNFTQALTGTIAYDHAAVIYANAGPPNAFPPPNQPPFGPVNPGGLTDCIPPLELSPLGTVAYLSEMLQVSESSTCDDPFAPPALGHTALQSVIDNRRGPVETLAVTHANVETPLPMIDMVNECLEYMASFDPPANHGTVYDTSEDSLAGYELCRDHCGEDEHDDCGCEPKRCCCEERRHKEHDDCHKPARIFDALPEYSTPATPVAANADVTPAVWNKLKDDFSACCLPYDQALDVNRTYLEHFRSCRFEEMRTFRRCITEFVLDPAGQPADFQTHLWRYPVRLDIAIEYLGISPEEFATLFKGVLPGPCGGDATFPPRVPTDVNLNVERNERIPAAVSVPLPKFLKETCLTYCEFFELWQSQFVQFSNGEREDGEFPKCEPCCLDDLSVTFPDGAVDGAVERLFVFIRLWHKLRHHCGAHYTFAQLADICTVLDLSSPDFVRQLAAFQMLRDQFRLKLTGHKPPAGPGPADRTWLLSLWVGPGAEHWDWAVHHLLEGIAHHAKCHHKCERRGAEFINLLKANLDPLSRLAGFDPNTPSDTWQAVPTHTLRLAEVLSKIYASKFTIGEVLYLFDADTHLGGEDPFPLEDLNESNDSPLGLPEEAHDHSLWHLRHKLLQIHGDEEDARHWSWHRVVHSLTREFGFAMADVIQFGEHFFAHTLEHSGHPVTAAARRFTANLAGTNAAMWNATAEGPFRYDAAAHQLWAVLPINDQEVLEQLTRLQALDPAEQPAVQDVYFAPRLTLSTFALLFDDFAAAEDALIQNREEEDRWRYFQRQFQKCHARCRALARHLSGHVEAVTRQECPEGDAEALLILKDLYADENAALSPWENDNGQVPPVTWTSPANGGAFAALLGLTGTGVDGVLTVEGGAVAWKEIRDSMSPFGHERDRENCPVPAVIPSMGLALTPQEMRYVSVLNGLAMDDASGHWLGGAQAFHARWDGVLMVDESGEYHFRAGAPTEGHAEPEEAPHRSWKVILRRGQRTWILLRHQWNGEENIGRAELRLERGAYDLTVEFVQHKPEFLHEDEIRHQHTGFQIKYRGPDTQGELTAIHHQHLFRRKTDAPIEVPGLAGSPAAFLRNRYASSLRDIRRTYQRAFKALLFTHRFRLSARPHAGDASELGYLLSQPALFAGWSYYRNGGVFTTHKADFDFNLLPVGDPYLPPAADDRANPSPKRIQALFDWWERIFDYTRMRHEVEEHCERHVWHLFEQAHDQNPADPAALLRHLGADARHWRLDLRFFQDQAAPVYTIATADLRDERWTLRAWHTDLWLRRLWEHFTVKDITVARPDLWASTDPAALVPGAPETGNANLLQFLCDGCWENGEARRYDDVRRLNDGLRERGRKALLCYLCGPNGIAKSPNELSEMLLLDVLAGRCEKASRIEEAISAVQTFIRRARLGLEPGWTVSGAFAHMWDCRFTTFHVWQASKRRELYKENWIDWHELEKAGEIEALRFLQEQLKRATLTIAEPGGVDYWPDLRPPFHPGLCLLQRRDPAEMQILPAAREGLNLLATPECDARPSWITRVPDRAAKAPPPPGALAAGIAAGAGAAAPPAVKLPFWMETAIRLGARFVRVAAAAYPPASTEFEARHECKGTGAPAPATGNQAPAQDKECCTSCCKECGCEHPALVDEYYFWLIDAKYFDPETQSVYTNIFDGQQNEFYDQNAQTGTPWHDVTQLPGLLAWPPEPMVRLAWCRVHNGEFQQPRRSDWGISFPGAGPAPDLRFVGRVADSLYLEVTVPGGVGFRYDMVPDTAEELKPLVIPPAAPAPPPPAGLFAYPYFAYFEPGARLFPWSLYSPAIAVAHALRTHCRFEAALKWYERVYNPLDQDNRWALCETTTLPSRGTGSLANAPADTIAVPLPDPGCCCDSTKITCRDARHRSILLHYLDTLLEWGDALVRRNSPEAFEQARLIFDTMRKILGRHPRMVKNPAHPAQTVATFDALQAAVNPRLITLYDQVDDRLSTVHDCLSHMRLAETQRTSDAQYWGDDPSRRGWIDALSSCCETDGSCRKCRPYRFSVRIQRAKELASVVRELGGSLQAAFEKGDAEFLASVRARHEREIAHLNVKVREDLWRDSDWQVQALEKSKQALQSSRRYYANLIANGLIPHETGYVDVTNASMDDRAAANLMEGIAEAMDLVPDVFVGTSDFVQLPVGTKLAGLFQTIARVTNTIADIAGSTASLDLTEASWDRRLQDWVHQVEVLDIQIEQTELQILGAERRRDQALRELNIQQRSFEQATEVLDILRDKLTNHALYLFLQKYTADLYRAAYELALKGAHDAEKAFNFERGHTAWKFIGCHNWDNLHEGLLAGERLQLDLARMEQEYLDRNCREYELTKHISLQLQSPLEFLRLKLTGRCEIEIPEWMFDLDYPGQYMRRIRSVSLTVACVAGPYNEVHCRLTLLRSGTRIDPLPRVPAARCCDCCQSSNGYPVCAHDPRWVAENGALEAIATSSGQNDAGLFEVNFRDDRYLPFEYHGAVSRWRIEMPHENNFFDMDSLTDVVMHLNYTSREGGEALRRAAREATECKLPGAGWRLFDLRHDFADSWQLFDDRPWGKGGRELELSFHRNMFPYIPGGQELCIESIGVLFEKPEHCGCKCPGECPCCSDPTPAQHELELKVCGQDERRFRCQTSEHWPCLYHGVVDRLRIGPLGRQKTQHLGLKFPPSIRGIGAAYLLCRYCVLEKCSEIKVSDRRTG